MMQSFPWPFANGIQDADAKVSATQQPRLVDALNVHVRPENINALSVRPGLNGLGGSVDGYARLARAGDKIATIGAGTYGIRSGSDTTSTSFNSPLRGNMVRPRRWGVVGVTNYAFPRGTVTYVAYAESSLGDSAVFAVVKEDSGPSVLYVQQTISGIRYTANVVSRSIAEKGVGTDNYGKVFAFRNTNGGFTVLVNEDDGSGSFRIALYASTAAPSIDLTYKATLASGDVWLCDADGFDTSVTPTDPGAAERIIYTFCDSSDEQIKFGVCNYDGSSIVQSPSKVDDFLDEGGGFQVAPVAVGVAVTDAPNKVAHVYSFYSSSTSGSGATIRCHQVTWDSAASTLREEIGNLEQATPGALTMSVCGGAMRVSPSSGATELGSYCFVGCGAVGSWQVENAYIVQFGASGTKKILTKAPPIMPMGRIYADSTFYGARIWGNMIAVSGLWELTPTTNTTDNDVILCVPLAYYSVSNGVYESLKQQTEGISVNGGSRGFSVRHRTNGSKALLVNRNTESIVLVDAGLESETAGHSVSGGPVDVVLGGVPRYWDGVAFVPAGIPQPPVVHNATAGTSGSLPEGNYLYGFVWEWTDARGERQQSGATIISLQMESNGSMAALIPRASIPYDERLVGGKTGIRMVVYRSEAGSDRLRRIIGGEVELNRVGTNAELYGHLSWIVRDDGNNPLDFETLYMSPGDNNELEATALEDTYLMRPFSERYAYVSRSFPNQLNYTKTKRPGRAIEPNQQLNFVMPAPATGLAVQDGNIYWLTRENVFAFNPQFADDTGLDGGGVDAIPLSPGIGCTQSNSVVETAVGVIFFSARGPHIIPRGGGSPQFIGLDIERWVNQYPVCVASGFNPRTSEAIFAMNNTEGTEHCIFVYNIMLNQWFRWIISADAAGGPVQQITSMVVSSAGIVCVSYRYATTNYRSGVFRINGISRDSSGGNPSIARNIQIRVETASIKLFAGGPGEQGRVDRVVVDASSETGSSLLISESHDDGATWSTEYGIETGSRNDPPVYRLAVQRTRGVRLRIRTTYNGQPNPDNQLVPPQQLAGITVYGYKLGRATTGRQRG